MSRAPDSLADYYFTYGFTAEDRGIEGAGEVWVQRKVLDLASSQEDTFLSYSRPGFVFFSICSFHRGRLSTFRAARTGQ